MRDIGIWFEFKLTLGQVEKANRAQGKYVFALPTDLSSPSWPPVSAGIVMGTRARPGVWATFARPGVVDES